MIQLLIDRPGRNIVGITIVTGLTIVADPRVRKVQRWHERIGGRVAHDAVLGCRDMRAGFSGSDNSVVTGYTVVNNTRVAKNCPGKGSCAEMTVRAILVCGGCRYVINGLARNDNVVVTGRAVIGHTGVIVSTGSKGARGVANLTIQRSRHVVDRFAARRNAMTGIATRGQHGRVGMVDAESG